MEILKHVYGDTLEKIILDIKHQINDHEKYLAHSTKRSELVRKEVNNDINQMNKLQS